MSGTIELSSFAVDLDIDLPSLMTVECNVRFTHIHHCDRV